MLISMSLQTLPIQPASADHFFARLWRLEKEKYYHGKEPAMCGDTAIETLAENIDWLEHHIDKYGSVVTKTPDIWGESRWTRHRFEYESVLKKELERFEVKLQGSLRRSDQAFLGMALSLQAVAANQSPGLRPPGVGPQTIILPDKTEIKTDNIFNQVNATLPDPTAPLLNAAKTEVLAPASISRTEAFGLPIGANVAFPDPTISIEPTVELDQLSRYINHLHELRRINEGDDVGDSPGYALNLVRIPVSILPGKLTQTGFGAEVTVIAEPYLGPDLLPVTFRTLVLNDLVDMLAPVITHLANQPIPAVKLREGQATQGQSKINESAVFGMAAEDTLSNDDGSRVEGSRFASIPEIRAMEQADAVTEGWKAFGAADDSESPDSPTSPAPAVITKALSDAYVEAIASVSPSVQAMLTSPVMNNRRSRTPIPLSQVADVIGKRELALLVFEVRRGLLREPQSHPHIHHMDVRAFLRAELEGAYDHLITIENEPLWNTHCTPQLTSVIYGRRIPSIEILRANFLCDLGQEKAREFIEPGIIQPAALVEEIVTPPHRPSLAAAETINPFTSSPSEIERAEPTMGPINCPPMEAKLFRLPSCDDCTKVDAVGEPICKLVTGVLAWGVIVESALLNERLQDDIRETAGLKGAPLPIDCPMPFFGPNPPPEARDVFNEYVRHRWPIHVFALDPVNQEQNIADEFSRRRELQIALSLAFAADQINAQSLMRFARRLEWDMATIALNRTQVGFSHGNDTFGWRFFPRFQTPPVSTGIGAFGETLLGGPSRERDLNTRQIEPGIRECTAIVIMPSFVPYAMFDVRTNWFKLSNPKNAALTIKDTMKLSRAVTSMRNGKVLYAQCEQCYREGEVRRLLRRVDQLDRELPLQTMQVQIPYENTAGGFEVFNSGVTELAPELIGYYGEPGINPAGITEMFLVGDGFSVHDTRVIAGDRECSFELISRQLMKVTFPGALLTLAETSMHAHDTDPAHRVVDVHVATPYGVSSHLLIPVAPVGHITAPTTSQPAFRFADIGPMTFTYKTTQASSTAPIVVDAVFALDFPKGVIDVNVPEVPNLQIEASLLFRASEEPLGLINTFRVDKVPLNPPLFRYQLAGTKLTEFNTKLTGVMKEYLERRHNSANPPTGPLRVTISGVFIDSNTGLPTPLNNSIEIIFKK
jgi:hypothetical protein